MKPKWLANATAPVLLVLLCFGILTVWVPERWALAAYQVGAFLLAGAWILTATIRPFRPEYNRALIPLSAIVLWGVLQVATQRTIYPWETWNSVLNWATNACLFFLALQLFTEHRLRRWFLNGLLYFGFGLSVVSTVQMFTSDGKIFWLFPSGYPDFVLGPFVYRNQYAAFIETVLPLALYRAVSEPQRSFRYWVMVAIMVASVVAGGSRAGSVLVLLEVLTIPLLALARRASSARTVGLALGQFALLAIIATGVVGWEFLWQRFQQADPYVARREMLLSSVEMIKERPWTGFGLGTWPTAYPKYALYDDGTFVNQAHNDWAQWAVEGGLPLLAAMLVFGAMLVRPAVRSLWGIGVISVLIHCLVDYPMQQRPALAGWFFAMAGVLAALSTKERIPKPGESMSDSQRQTQDCVL
jgi:O-antigen ligase